MDYKKLGFKCGIEIHQQLEGKKLFCNCPTIIRKDTPDYSFTRQLRASAGESGNVDKAASFEQQKQKTFVYQGYEDTNCLVEQDEEPPRPVNQKAVETALQVCKMLNCKIVDEIIFMRKVVVDGSNVSGFQRTALVGQDGYVKVNGRKIGIESVCLEEEACQVIKRTDDKDTYNLSRLGIPLIEIATAPDITNPKECQETAAKLGMFLRSTGSCRRGIGSIRQDVNISIKEGYRVEVKGFQDLKSIPKIVEFEINRQIEEKEKQGPHVRKAQADFTTSFLRPMPGSGRMYPETDIPLVKVDLTNIKEIETLEEKQSELEKNYKLNSDFASIAIKSEIDFPKIFNKYKNLEPKFIVNTIINLPKEIRKRHNVEIDILENSDFILSALNENKISPSAIEEILLKLNKNEKVNLDNYKTMPIEEIENKIKEILKENEGAPMGALMGKAMAAFQGKVDGKVVNEIIRKLQ